MERKKIEAVILAKAIEKGDKKYINCQDAVHIAEELNLAPIEVGKICNELKIKIENCRLGCF